MIFIHADSRIVHLLKSKVFALSFDWRIIIVERLITLVASVVLDGILGELRAYAHVRLLLPFDVTGSFTQQRLSLLS